MDLPEPGRVLEALQDTTWWQLVVALAFHAASIVVRAQAWRNILADDFPESRVPARGIFGAYAAGVGVNSVLPARLGDAVKLLIAKRQVPEASYPALISTLFVFALGDALIGAGFIVWAVSAGAVPGFDELVADPGSGLAWLAAHPWITAVASAAVVLGLVLAFVFARRQMARIKAGFVRGLAVLRDWPFYPLHVLSWQGLGWALQLASFWWFFHAFDLPASIRDAAVVQAIAAMSTAVPITASGAGAEQAILLVVFEGRFDEADLFSFAFGMRASTILLNVAIGFAAMLLLLRTLRFRRLVELEHELLEHVHLPRGVGARLRRLRPASSAGRRSGRGRGRTERARRERDPRA